MTSPIGSSPKYNMQGVEITYPDTPNVMILTKHEADGSESKLVVDSTNLNLEDKITVLEVQVQHCKQEQERIFAEQEKLLEKQEKQLERDEKRIERNEKRIEENAKEIEETYKHIEEFDKVIAEFDRQTNERNELIQQKEREDRLSQSKPSELGKLCAKANKFVKKKATQMKGFFLE